jgi:hypothetical protein
VQVGSADVSPAAAVEAPVDANAPVCVLAACSSASGGQQSGGASASSGGSGSGGAGGQSASQSLGTVQVGSADVSPAVAAEAPVDANAPVCVLAACSSVSGGQQTGGGPGGGGTGGGPGGGDTGGGPGGGDTGGGPGGGGSGGGPGGGGSGGSGPGGGTTEVHVSPIVPAPGAAPTPLETVSLTPRNRGTLGDSRFPSTTRSPGAKSGLGSPTATGSRPSAAGTLAVHEAVSPVRLPTGVLPFAGLSLAFALALGLALVVCGGASRLCFKAGNNV